MDYRLQKKEISKYIDSKHVLLVLLDFDGTLVPIVSDPNDAHLPDETKVLLRRLTTYPTIELGIISGRKLSDIKKKVGIRRILYSGSHGFEWEYRGTVQHPDIRVPELLPILAHRLKYLTVAYPGVILEDKGYIVTIHYRMVPDFQHTALFSDIQSIFSMYSGSSDLTLVKGKKTFEIKPPVKWNKGEFIKYFIKNHYHETGTSVGIIYIGDDVTDEDVFSLFPHDITVKVGPEITKARFTVRDPYETIVFLNWLTECLRQMV